MKKTPVIFDHDGGVDDLLSLMLLLTMEHIDVIGVTITPADCFLSDATKSTLKILKLFNRTQVPVAQGNHHGIHPFHYDWRAQPKMVNALPTMLSIEENTSQITSEAADQFIANALTKTSEPVTVLMTGPCTNLVKAFEIAPTCKANIDKVVWMGGAVDVKGNVANYNHDGSAEWNVYWDYLSSQALFQSGVAVELIALDATNCLPIDETFLKELAKHRNFALAELSGQFWACTVASVPTYEFTYFLWDVMATCTLGISEEAITYENIKLSVSIEEPSEGNTYRTEEGNNIKVAMQADRDMVLDYLFKQLQYQL